MKRLYIGIISSVIIALFLINWGVDKLAQETSKSNESNELVLYKKIIEGLSADLGSGNEKLTKVEIVNQAEHLAKLYQLNVVIEDSSDLAFPASLQQQLTQPGGLLLSSSQNTYLLKAITHYPQWLIRLEMLEQEENQQHNVLLTSLLYLGVCGLLVLWLFPLTRRLYLLTQTATKISEGQLNTRMPSSQFSYIEKLESEFNKMAGQIETLVSDNKMLARSLSHDIRTPLACLRFGIEAAIECPDIAKKNHYINKMDTEVTRMENMTEAFLNYASLERKSLNINKQRHNINDIITGLSHDLLPLAQKRQLTIKTDLPEQPLLASVDSHWCYLALQNLVGNAVKYAQHTIIISLVKLDENHIKIAVEDDGKGIADSELERIFKPFVKLDNVRLENENFGLGLATAAKIMQWHQGRIFAQQASTLSGLSCQLVFPVNNN